MKILRWLYDQLDGAWNHLIGIAIPMAIAWFIGRHLLWWMFCIFYAVETGGPRHFGSPPHPESQIASGEFWLANLAAYATGAFFMYARWAWWGFDAIARREQVSPTLLYFMAGPRNVGMGGLLLLPIWMVLFAPYLLWYIALSVLRLLGVRALIAGALRDKHADVIDISAGSPWRSAHR